jgi:hypothetical protein
VVIEDSLFVTATKLCPICRYEGEGEKMRRRMLALTACFCIQRIGVLVSRPCRLHFGGHQKQVLVLEEEKAVRLMHWECAWCQLEDHG